MNLIGLADIWPINHKYSTSFMHVGTAGPRAPRSARPSMRPDRTLRNWLKDLVEEGAIESRGERKGRRYRLVERPAGAVPGADLTTRVAVEQFAPTAAAVVVTAVAVLPFALASGASGNELTQPMAVVILAGLVTATVVNLLIVPAICLAFGAAIPVGAEPLATEADEGTDTSPRQARGT